MRLAIKCVNYFIFKKILCYDRCASPDTRPDIRKPVLRFLINRMMVDADDLIPGHIDNVGIALLRIYQDNLVVLREFTVNILNIYQSDVQNLSQLVSTVTVDFPLIADRCMNPSKL